MYSVAASTGHWNVTRWFLEFALRRSIATHSALIETPPLRDRDLLLAKLIAAVVPALLVTWAAAVVGISAGVLGSVWRVGQVILPTAGNLVGLLLLAPAMATVAALGGLRVSARFTDVPGAMQLQRMLSSA